METTKPVRMLCTYRVKDGKEADFLQLLARHWPTLHGLGLATDDPAQVFRCRDKSGRTILVELFSWKDAAAPEVAHQTPEVMAVWEPMGALTEGMDFWAIEAVALDFAKD